MLKQDAEDEEEKLWKGLKMDRVLRACEASLIILHITTAPEMPKQVYMEEVIEHVVSFCRFQLENTIYPEYDPVYRVDPDSKCEYKRCFLPVQLSSVFTSYQLCHFFIAPAFLQ